MLLLWHEAWVTSMCLSQRERGNFRQVRRQNPPIYSSERPKTLDGTAGCILVVSSPYIVQ